MDLMVYKFRKSLLLVILIAVAVPVKAQTPVFNQLKTIFNEGRVFKASYSHVYEDSYTNERITSEGQIWIAEKAYKLESDGQVLIVDGVTSQVYDEYRNRVIISDYVEEDDEFAPSKMLKGVDSTYTVVEKKNQDGTTSITMQTDDDFALYMEVVITVDRNGKPVTIQAVDFAENKIITSFSKGTFLNPSDNLFVLNYPEDSEIVDTRY